MDEVVLWPGMTFEPDPAVRTYRVRCESAELERLQAIEARALEWYRGTNLYYPSVTEAAIHSAMGEVLHGPG